MLLDQLHVQAWRLRSQSVQQASESLPESIELGSVATPEDVTVGVSDYTAQQDVEPIVTIEPEAATTPQADVQVPTLTPTMAPVMPVPEPAESMPKILAAPEAVVAEPATTDPVAVADWAALQSMINTGLLCPSCNTNNAVLGHGSQQAEWLFVFDSPTSTDLRERQICNGRAGSLYDALLAACGFERAQVYTTTVFKCAPTDDLSLSPACHDILRRQIELIEPKVVVAFGEFAAQSVLKANEPLGVLRQQLQTCFSTGVRVVPTFSPLQMLEHNELKADVWHDLSAALRWYRQSR